jgi:hypothetical protein
MDFNADGRCRAALDWIARSIRATGGRGSSHSYSPLFGWARAYPETTGYLIETLLESAERRGETILRDLAFQSADWLCTVQLPSGAFAGLLAGHDRPSVFNTAQILFGLTRAADATDRDDRAARYRQAAQRAVRWLLDGLEADGSWRRAAYVPGFTPSYSPRAVWGVLTVDRLAPSAGVGDAMRRALAFYARRWQDDGTVADWGFHPGRPAFTHTIAYTLEGFWECARHFGDEALLRRVEHALNNLWETRRRTGRTAGRYAAGWRGDYSFQCVPGLAQLSSLYARCHRHRPRPWLQEAAQAFWTEVCPHQRLNRPRSPAYGALPGSAPFWGPYLRGRYPNWGVKFFLDAYYLLSE